MRFYSILNTDTMRWHGVCASCGGVVDLCDFEESPEDADVKHICGELTFDRLRDLWEAGGIDAVADAFGVPDYLR